MQILLLCILLLKLFITPVRIFLMADGDKHDCPSRRFSAKDALQMILASDLYSSDSSTDCYYSHESSSESSSEDELPSATQRKRSKFEGPTKNQTQTVNNNTIATNNNELCDSNWKDVSTIENDNRKFEFRFIPAKKTGVCADITSNSTPLDCSHC